MRRHDQYQHRFYRSDFCRHILKTSHQQLQNIDRSRLAALKCCRASKLLRGCRIRCRQDLTNERTNCACSQSYIRFLLLSTRVQTSHRWWQTAASAQPRPAHLLYMQHSKSRQQAQRHLLRIATSSFQRIVTLLAKYLLPSSRH